MKKKAENIGFPLKDEKGKLQVCKMGIDSVIDDHFKKVFTQNPIPDRIQWKMYWEEVDQVFDLIKDESRGDVQAPNIDEIEKLFHAINTKKSVLGVMTGDLVKMINDPMVIMIKNFILKCLYEEDIPTDVKMERMTLLYKNIGELSNIDNYRGIFLRHIILSILQKWLYSRCSPTLDENGSEYAFGGRKGRAVNEVLLIVRLVQDHCHWTGQPLILKFLDVKKFFDTMNFKKCLIEAYKSGLTGKYWNMYQAINKFKECVPYTPLGNCKTIEVNRVFVQGSSDAMLMAWNLVDAINKKEDDVYDPVFIIEEISVPRLLFVDDVLEMARSVADTNINTISNEVFEKENRIEYKPIKCKLMPSNTCCEENSVKLNGTPLDIVDEHKYLGTLVSKKGRSDMKQRVKDCNGVLNEIVEVCNKSGVGNIRLKFVRMLTESCFKSKFKFGCEVWDPLKKSDTDEINKLIPNMIKRVLELPRSTPTTAIQHEFGIVDMDLEIDMERILLAVKVLDMDEQRVAKQLLLRMMEKNVPGFCQAASQSLERFGIALEVFNGVWTRGSL